MPPSYRDSYRAELDAQQPTSWLSYVWLTHIQRSGWRLTLLTLGCLLIIAGCSWRMFINGAGVREVYVGVCLFLACLAGEYAEHRWDLHARATSNAHKNMHHVFFTHAHMSYETWSDLPAVLFDADFAARLVLFVAPILATGVGCVLGAASGWCAWATFVLWYLVYEWLHLACHSDPTHSWISRLPGVATLRHHHQTHHDPSRMGRYNFGITSPTFDWLLGTMAPRDAP
jgi:hypothetical protein